MERAALIDFIKEYFASSPEYLFSDDLNTAVFRHSDNRKWFALIMNIPREKLGLYGKKNVDVVNLKCDPLLTGSLIKDGGVFPAYHMNKEKWISVLLDGSVDADKIRWLTGLSFELTAKKPKKRTK